MNALLIYNQSTAKWNVFSVVRNCVVHKNYSKEEAVKWASSNGYSNIVRK